MWRLFAPAPQSYFLKTNHTKVFKHFLIDYPNIHLHFSVNILTTGSPNASKRRPLPATWQITDPVLHFQISFPVLLLPSSCTSQVPLYESHSSKGIRLLLILGLTYLSYITLLLPSGHAVSQYLEDHYTSCQAFEKKCSSKGNI
ncbi:unnamed protein product [Natator depressus]